MVGSITLVSWCLFWKNNVYKNKPMLTITAHIFSGSCTFTKKNSLKISCHNTPASQVIFYLPSPKILQNRDSSKPSETPPLNASPRSTAHVFWKERNSRKASGLAEKPQLGFYGLETAGSPTEFILPSTKMEPQKKREIVWKIWCDGIFSFQPFVSFRRGVFSVHSLQRVDNLL